MPAWVRWNGQELLGIEPLPDGARRFLIRRRGTLSRLGRLGALLGRWLPVCR